jgi:hypothetical protein
MTTKGGRLLQKKTKGGRGSEFIVVTILHIVKDYDHRLLIVYILADFV